MRIRVLGSAAGGGFPQWNCNCSNCKGFRSHQIRALARSQSSIAVSNGTDGSFVVINASPDLGTQLRNWPESQPGKGIRDTAIMGVVLVDSQIDHCTGLLSLRENKTLRVYCTDPVFEDLTTGLPILNVLQSYVALERFPIGLSTNDNWTVPEVKGLIFRALAVKGKAPPYSPRREKGVIGDNIALEVTNIRTNKKLLYAPGIKVIDAEFEKTALRADCIMIDGTFWTDDEMSVHGISNKRAKDMGHLCLSGAGGTIDFLQKFPSTRRVLIHINNTNPMLNIDSKEKRILDELGIEIAFDGMEIDL